MNVIDYSKSKQLAIEHQKQIIADAESYLKSGGRELVISGAAGTGKSYLTRQLLERIVRNGEKILICALSHQAVGVANNFMSGSRLKFKTSTLASAIAARKTINENGVVEFKVTEQYEYVNGMRRLKKPPIAEADIIIIDECSQLSSKYLEMINSVKKSNAIVIYLGDICQLPPPERGEDEIFSPVFKLNKVFELIYPFRYEGEIAEFGHFLRNEIHKGIDGQEFNARCWLDIADEKNSDVRFFTDKKLFRDAMFDKFKEDDMFTKYIAYTRANYQRTGEYIRNYLNPNRPPFEKNDNVICKNNYYYNEILKLQNGEQKKITGKRKLTGFVIWIIDGQNNKRFMNFLEKSKTSAKKLQIYYSTTFGIDKDKIIVEELDYWSHDFDGGVKFVPTKPVSEKYFNGLLDALAKRDVLHPISSYSNNFQALESMREFFCEIQYAYALTSHTSQGSTYSNVFVNTDDIYGVKFTSDLEKLQSFYVAITRATKQVNILHTT